MQNPMNSITHIGAGSNKIIGEASNIFRSCIFCIT